MRRKARVKTTCRQIAGSNGPERPRSGGVPGGLDSLIAAVAVGRYGAGVDRDLLGLHHEVHPLPRRQPQFGRRLGGDVGGQPGRAVGLLLGAHPHRRSAAVQFGDDRPRRRCAGCRAACRGTPRPPTARTPPPPESPGRDRRRRGCRAMPSPTRCAACRRSPSRPATRFTPANRAPNRLRGAAKTVVAGPDSTIRPASSTTTRSASVTTSSRSWVTSIADRPSRASTRRSTLRIAVATATSRPASGSSSSSTSGSAASARASATRCACPPDSWRGIRSTSSAASTSAEPVLGQLPGILAAQAALPLRGPNATFVADVQVRKQQRILHQQADPPVVGGDVDRRPRVSVSIRSPTRTVARVGPHQAGDDVQHGRLARPVGAEDRQHLARRDAEFDVQRRRSPTTARTSTPLTSAHQPLTPPALSLRLPSPTTTTAATATSSTDSATAASASTLPLQVDLQRQGAGHALAGPGERQRRAELAERAGEGQHRARHQARAPAAATTPATTPWSGAPPASPPPPRSRRPRCGPRPRAR